MSYFPPCGHSKNKIEIKLNQRDLSNYAEISDLENTTGVDTSPFAINPDLVASLKTTVDKLDVDQLKNVPDGLNSFKS